MHVCVCIYDIFKYPKCVILFPPNKKNAHTHTHTSRCWALPSFTESRAPNDPRNHKLLAKGLNQWDVTKLKKRAKRLNQSGYVSFLEDFQHCDLGQNMLEGQFSKWKILKTLTSEKLIDVHSKKKQQKCGCIWVLCQLQILPPSLNLTNILVKMKGKFLMTAKSCSIWDEENL